MPGWFDTQHRGCYKNPSRPVCRLIRRGIRHRLSKPDKIDF
jgi:hypothetical protein